VNIFQEMLGDKKNEDQDNKREAKTDKKEVKKLIDYHESTNPATGILPRHLDPRPDIKADHEDWVDMLQNCLVWDGFKANHGGKEGYGEKLWGVLHGLRCGGARIQRVKSSGSGGGLGYKLLPGSEDWKQEAEWQRIRKEHLDGVKEDLVELFKFTKEHGRLARMEEIWPEGNGAEDKNNNVPKGSQTKLF
jgi:hypothetical protein